MSYRTPVGAAEAVQELVDAIGPRPTGFHDPERVASLINHLFRHEVATGEEGRVLIGPMALRKLLLAALGAPVGFGPGSCSYIIRKQSRAGTSPYAGPACENAGVKPGQVYQDVGEAFRDARLLSKVNPVGFEVVDKDTGETVPGAQESLPLRKRAGTASRDDWARHQYEQDKFNTQFELGSLGLGAVFGEGMRRGRRRP